MRCGLISVMMAIPLSVVVTTAAYAAVPLAEPGSDRARALQCMASAISYEAGQESIEGQEAVAQVILNRVRHPAYPKTICGVVFQGSKRKTGCQFTFTCDGSLAKAHSARSQTEAMLVAERVLDGQAISSVGGATHYHANYVSPKWAPRLIKIATIGAHLFYRLPDAQSSPAFITPGAMGVEIAGDAPPAGAIQSSPRPRAAPYAVPPFSPWGLPLQTATAGR